MQNQIIGGSKKEKIMDKVFIDPEIYYIENFISKSDLEVILSMYKDENSWTKSGDFYLKHNVTPEVSTVLDFYKNKIEEIINNDKEICNFTPSLSKFKKTESEWAIAPHPDRWIPEINPDNGYNDPHANPSSQYVTKGYILYFNDEYEGGELYYLNQDITFRPKAGMLVVHSGYPEYMHAVKPILSGERYMLTGFVYERDNWP
jgi:hypothetical protein